MTYMTIDRTHGNLSTLLIDAALILGRVSAVNTSMVSPEMACPSCAVPKIAASKSVWENNKVSAYFRVTAD